LFERIRLKFESADTAATKLPILLRAPNASATEIEMLPAPRRLYRFGKHDD